MTDIHLITLDLDNTLWDVDRIIIAAEAELRDWLAAHTPQALAAYEKEQLMALREAVSAQFPDQIHDLSFMRTAVLQALMRKVGYGENEALQMAQAAFEVFFEARNRVEFFPGALDMLDDLARRFHIVALTNGNADIHRAGLGEYLKGAYSSADVGHSKPHRNMFLAPLQALNLAPHQAIHIGDHLIDDIQGAADVGMHSVWVNLQEVPVKHEASQAEPDHLKVQPSAEVSHLSEVAEAVARIASAD